MKTIELRALNGKTYKFEYEPVVETPVASTLPEVLESLGEALI
jgi:hypothetical protein